MSGRPVVARTRAELAAALAAWEGRGAAPGPGGRGGRAVVMTMGALHEGHLELVRRARAEVGPEGQVVTTIFVNPLQFGAGEDLDRYPRDLDSDIVALAAVGTDVIFAPPPDVVYPGGDPMVRVSAGALGQVLEGAARPGHFDGVLTVVLKLTHLTRPDVALFGRKDAQQLIAVRRMVADLDLPVRIVAVPIVRDDDGLALSSRNAYLTPDQRRAALGLYAALRAAAGAAAGPPPGTARAVLAAAGAVLADRPGVDLDYLVLVDPQDARPIPADAPGVGLLLVAARVGTTRLIDNTLVGVDGAVGVMGGIEGGPAAAPG